MDRIAYTFAIASAVGIYTHKIFTVTIKRNSGGDARGDGPFRSHLPPTTASLRAHMSAGARLLKNHLPTSYDEIMMLLIYIYDIFLSSLLSDA